MEPEQLNKQLAKYRSQQRVNRIIINTALVILGLIVLSGVTVFAVNQFRPTPTLTPSEFQKEFSNLRGRTVKIKGRVKLFAQDAYLIRLVDDKNVSILCRLLESTDLKDGQEITVKGQVGPTGGLMDCVIEE
jgi:hypothetical protein